MKLSNRVLSSLLAMVAAGCGANDELSGEEAASLDSALVAPAAGVNTERVSMTSPNWTATAWQSETAGSAKDDFEYVAYNAEDTDTTHVTYPQRVERDPQNRPFVDRVVCP